MGEYVMRAIDAFPWDKQEYGENALQIRQFVRLGRLYPEALGAEAVMGERYRYMLRTRSDSVFSKPWWSLSQMKQEIGTRTIGIASIENDRIWICGREAAFSMMHMFPSMLYRPLKRTEIGDAIGDRDKVYANPALWPEHVYAWWIGKNRGCYDIQRRCDLFGTWAPHA